MLKIEIKLNESTLENITEDQNNEFALTAAAYTDDGTPVDLLSVLSMLTVVLKDTIHTLSKGDKYLEAVMCNKAADMVVNIPAFSAHRILYVNGEGESNYDRN